MAENHALIPEATSIYTQTNMKESQDISKNLMSGDFEKQFRGAMVDEKTDRRWQTWLITLGVVVGAVVLWLVVFTVVREVQVRQLRHEVDELTANMIALSSNVKSLNQKIDKNKLLNEFKDFQDTIYADEDISSIGDGKETVKDRVYDSLEKLHGLTVLEDDSQDDDEDLLDTGDDAESGDWYPDYDKREHIGSTNMVHLQPDDFVDSEVMFRTDGDRNMISNIREIKRKLNENPEDPDLELTFKTADSKPADSPKQVVVPVESVRDKRSVFPDSTADAVDDYAVPRTMAKTDERRKTKKYSSSSDGFIPKMALHSVTRTIRNSEYDEERRPFIAAHFHGNTSHLNTEIHDFYKGNGLVRVSHGAHHDVWYPAPWTVMSPHPRPTLTRNGHVHVHHTGVYLVYVQIYYIDNHDSISWTLNRLNPAYEGTERVLQCAQSTHSNGEEKANSCYSSAAVFLRTGDKLVVRNTGTRHALMEPGKSFIGLIKLADAEDPVQEL